MDLRPRIFIEIIHLDHYRQLPNFERSTGLDVERINFEIKRRLDALVLHEELEAFVMREYSESVRLALRFATGYKRDEILAWYCRFQLSVCMLDRCPDLVAMFRAVGLEGWAILTADRDTLHPYVTSLMESFGVIAPEIYETTTIDPEIAHPWAELVMLMADCFRIDLSGKLRELVDWYMSNFHELGHPPLWLNQREGLRRAA